MSHRIIKLWINENSYMVHLTNYFLTIKPMQRVLALLVIVSLTLLSCAKDDTSLKVAPQVCESAVEPGVPAVGLPYRPYDVSFIQGGSIEDGDFIFDLWLYCYPLSKPSDADRISIVEGLGVYAGWGYRGLRIEGRTQDYWGFGMDYPYYSTVAPALGPLYKTKGGYRTGIEMSEEDVIERVKNGIPFHFEGKIESPVGIYGAVIQFKLEATEEGLIPKDVTVEPLNK